jgi:DNA-binding CsgD family transcriptional regulator
VSRNLTKADQRRRNLYILRLLSSGMSPKQIADELDTGHTYVLHLIKDMIDERGFKTRDQLMYELGRATERRSNLR